MSAPSRLAFIAVVGVDLLCALLALITVKWFLNPLQKQTTLTNITVKNAPRLEATDINTIEQNNATKSVLGEDSPQNNTTNTNNYTTNGKEEINKNNFAVDIFRISLRNWSRPKPLLLIPLTIFNGIEQAFVVGLYTKAYAGCALGINEIGFVMVWFGLVAACSSLVFGPLIKLFGRMPLLMFGAVINLLMLFVLMVWAVNPGDRVLFNAVAGVWGMADGVWNTQLNGFWLAILGPGRDQLEIAFANYRFWVSFGLALGFLLIRLTDIDNFLLIAFFFLFVGILGYFLVELFDIILVRLKMVK